ncbi:uncharacterized protein [Engystomops pustulosus]|uniref:uncharacterized protein n=1 Tax=Engystomops pustulosus TaxID=76066 RepID=UPI003AFA82F7
MENAALTLILVLAPCLTHACTLLSVTQKPLVPALTENQVKIECAIRLQSDAPIWVTSTLHRAGAPETLDLLSHPAENTTLTHEITVTRGTGVYICRARCGAHQKEGDGTYIYVRDSLYVAPSSSSYKLCCALIILFILLLLLAGSGTYLVLTFFWKRESSEVVESARSGAAVEDAGSSLYTSLEPRTEDVYNILGDKSRGKERPKTEKTKVTDNDVYENVQP